MMITNKIQIELNPSSIEALKNGGYTIQVFRGVKAAAPTEGKATVWRVVEDYLNQTTISFDAEPKIDGYFQRTISGPTGDITTSTSKPMEPGDTLTLKESWEAEVNSNGIPGAYMLLSEQKGVVRSGIKTANSIVENNTFCSFPQYPTSGNLLAPVNTVLVVFSNVKRETGRIVETLFSTSAFLKFSPENPTIELKYDILTGWNANDNPAVIIQPSNTLITPLLVTQSRNLKSALVKMM